MPQTKLLLADDSLTIQKVVSLTFADRGIDVVAFSDGETAVENLDSVDPDIVLADVHMPGINGYGVCELIRSSESTKHLPVVLLVGSFEPFDQDEADRVGANAYLTKPFSAIADIVSTVERLLAEAGSRQAEQLAEELPDTSDIDSLYEQSFAETMELPHEETIEFAVDVLDDEMIQTSYAEPDIVESFEDSLYVQVGDGNAPIGEPEDLATELLIAESLPVDDIRHDDHDRVVETSVEWEQTEQAESGSISATAQDPFETVAGEPLPVTSRLTPVPDAFHSDFDDNLLEIPRMPVRSIEYVAPNEPAANGREIISLSPELIDMIVERVIDRLSQQMKGQETRSVSG